MEPAMRPEYDPMLDIDMSENDDVLSENEDFDDDSQQGMFEHYRFNVDKGQSLLRIDKYITEHMEKTSRHRIQLAIDAGYVRVNDKIVKANYVVRPGDVVKFVMPYQRRGLEILPENIPLNIVHEDEDVLVLN